MGVRREEKEREQKGNGRDKGVGMGAFGPLLLGGDRWH